MKDYTSKNKTLVVRNEAKKFNINILFTISKFEKLRFMLYKDNMNSSKLIDFMVRLILANLYVHRSKNVQIVA